MDRYLKNIAILLLLGLSGIFSIIFEGSISPANSASAVDNRKPDINELPYTPQDGEITKTNPPYFIWLPQNNARKYMLQVSANKDFSSLYYSKVAIELNIHTPSITFTPGSYYWRYAFTDNSGNLSKFSIVRSFSVSESAVIFPMPSMEELESRIPLSHPRLFMRPEDVSKLRILAASSLLMERGYLIFRPGLLSLKNFSYSQHSACVIVSRLEASPPGGLLCFLGSLGLLR